MGAQEGSKIEEKTEEGAEEREDSGEQRGPWKPSPQQVCVQIL